MDEMHSYRIYTDTSGTRVSIYEEKPVSNIDRGGLERLFCWIFYVPFLFPQFPLGLISILWGKNKLKRAKNPTRQEDKTEYKRYSNEKRGKYLIRIGKFSLVLCIIMYIIFIVSLFMPELW